MTEWKPIDSAPKDGSKVDLWNHMTEQRITGAKFHNEKWKSPRVNVFGSIDWAAVPFPFELTHWMPIPEPPIGPSRSALDDATNDQP